MAQAGRRRGGKGGGGGRKGRGGLRITTWLVQPLKITLRRRALALSLCRTCSRRSGLSSFTTCMSSRCFRPGFSYRCANPRFCGAQKCIQGGGGAGKLGGSIRVLCDEEMPGDSIMH